MDSGSTVASCSTRIESSSHRLRRGIANGDPFREQGQAIEDLVVDLNRGRAGRLRRLEHKGYGNTCRRPGSVVGQPLAPLLPGESRFGPANLLAGELKGIGVCFKLRQPTGVEVIVDGLAQQTRPRPACVPSSSMRASGRTDRSRDSPVMRLSKATDAAFGCSRTTRRTRPFSSATSRPSGLRVALAANGFGSINQSPACATLPNR